MSNDDTKNKKCLICKSDINIISNIKAVDQKKYFPFCSKRCKEVDLYNWLGENYSIPIVQTDCLVESDPNIDTAFINYPSKRNI